MAAVQGGAPMAAASGVVPRLPAFSKEDDDSCMQLQIVLNTCEVRTVDKCLGEFEF